MKNRTLILVCCILFTGLSHAQTGAIPASVSVSQIGAAQYSIPIEVVPGTGGMQPNLSIQYNSMGGIGVMGSRWGISGLSQITCIARSIAYDGECGFNADGYPDRLALDGNRMVLLRGNGYNNNGAVYALENDNQQRIARVTAGNVVYYVDTLSDGRSVYYGQSLDSRWIVGNMQMGWLVSSVIDGVGNEMIYRYAQNDGEILVALH